MIEKEVLSNLVFSAKDFMDEVNKIYDYSGGAIDLLENNKLLRPHDTIIQYLDTTLPGECEASYWCLELNFGTEKYAKDAVEVDGVKFDLDTFDKWYDYLRYLELHPKEND